MNLEPEFIGREAISNRNCKVNSAASMFFFVCVCLPVCLCRPVLSVMTDSVTTICFVTNDNSTHYIFFFFLHNNRIVIQSSTVAVPLLCFVNLLLKVYRFLRSLFFSS